MFDSAYLIFGTYQMVQKIFILFFSFIKKYGYVLYWITGINKPQIEKKNVVSKLSAFIYE